MIFTKEAYWAGIKGKRVLFIGLGVSHRELVSLYLAHGAKVSVADQKTPYEIPEYEMLLAKGVTFHLGEDYLSHLEGDIIFRTPGLPFFTPELTKARQEGRVVTSELETFFALCPCPIYGVTGSDGKTTTSSIIAAMLSASGKKVHLGGNIGAPLLPQIDSIDREDLCVVELSSFQLISMRMSPQVAVVTNLSPNHLDMHKDMAEYVDAKRNIYAHQHGGTKTVLNWDNSITASFSPFVRDEVLWFSRLQTPAKGTFLRNDGMLCMALDGKKIPLFAKENIRIPGIHNVENFLAACAAVWGVVPVQTMEQVAKDFSGVEHRIEFVRQKDGVHYYNDAIATSPTRTQAGLRAFQQKVILIAGGYDKHVPFAPLVPTILSNVKALYLTGDTAGKIREAVEHSPRYHKESLPIFTFPDLEAAVHAAKEAAVEGDVVLLSPASASFDQYRNFEEKGHAFKEIVANL